MKGRTKEKGKTVIEFRSTYIWGEGPSRKGLSYRPPGYMYTRVQ